MSASEGQENPTRKFRPETLATTVDELIYEEQEHLGKAVRAAKRRGASPADEPSAQHAQEQVDRAESVKAYAQLLTQGSEFKTYLLRMATHDIKTPLTALAMQVDLMTSRPRSEEERQRAFGVLRRNIERLTTRLDGFLELARVEADRLTITPQQVDVGKLIQESVETFEEPAKHKSLKLETSPAPGLRAWGDDVRIAQIIGNLVSNAVRYSPPGGTIQVGAKETSEGVEIYVQDEGIGLSRDQILRISRPFVQVHAIPEESEGSGLGLYLSQALVEAHGGRLWLESPGPGRGTRATFTLPKSKAPGLE